MPPQPLTNHVLPSLLQRDVPATVKRAFAQCLGRAVVVWSFHGSITVVSISALRTDNKSSLCVTVVPQPFYTMRSLYVLSVSFVSAFFFVSSLRCRWNYSNICSQIILSHPAMAVLFSVPPSQPEYVTLTSSRLIEDRPRHYHRGYDRH